jgi:D-glycero-D-manno-heptose 1,7-bisphosphate phosphatase
MPGNVPISDRPAVFLDRDGVLNRALVRAGKPVPPASLAELEILPGVREACSELRRAGFLLVLVTNQPDIARGTQSRKIVDEINSLLQQELSIDDVRLCPHDDGEGCLCRKPESGLLTAAARANGISVEASVMVGDRWRDIEAGKRAGCKTVFIDNGYEERRPDSPDLTVASLSEAVSWILSQRTRAHVS